MQEGTVVSSPVSYEDTVNNVILPALAKSDYTLQKGDHVIGFCNFDASNTWRRAMVDYFVDAADQAKEQGWIKDYIVNNGDNTVNTQIAQMESYILQGVSAIVLNAYSDTALNAVIEEATKAGIPVIAFDTPVTSESAYKIPFDFYSWAADEIEAIARIVGEDAKIIHVRGIAGTGPDAQFAKAWENGIAKYPGMEVLATVHGNWQAATTLQELSKVLPSLTEVDAVTTEGGGDCYGVVQAFTQNPKLGMPMIYGDNTAEFVNWWKEQDAAGGYVTESQSTTPSISQIGLWVALAVLNGHDVPKSMSAPLAKVTQDDLSQIEPMQEGTVVSSPVSYEDTVNNVILPALAK